MDYIINGKPFTLIDTLEKIPTKDSFTSTENKTGGGNGAWEWHVGSKHDIVRYDFFGGAGFDDRCFLKKSDLIWLMNELQTEYFYPSQNYRSKNTFRAIWQQRVNEINGINEEYLFFRFREKSTRSAADSRLYAERPGTNADGDRYYGLMRKVGLPDITFTSILKLRAADGDTLFYFKIFPEFSDYIIEKPSDTQLITDINQSQIIPETEKNQLIKYRIGQGIFRTQILDDCKYCPITLVSDSRILIASHIKPWKVSTNSERLSRLNGFLFTPTFDKLFDAGYITFTNQKEIVISPWISDDSCTKLNILNNTVYPHLPTTGRETFLQYHRENI